MFHHSSQIDRLVLVSIATLLVGTTLVPDASGWHQPASPCPCAADGVCQPNGPWGHTPTKWRPWPGDRVGPAPTSDDEAETREQLQLDPFELPPISKEGQRGPNKSKPPKAKRSVDIEVDVKDAAEAAIDNALEPVAPMPEVNPLEGIDPGAFDIQDEFNLEPPAMELPQQEAEPLPGFDLQEEAEPEAEPPEEESPEAESIDDFDPFSRIDPWRSTPAPADRRTSLAPPVLDDTPPQLPPSLRKLSRRSPSTRRATLHDGRFVRPAVAMIQ